MKSPSWLYSTVLFVGYTACIHVACLVMYDFPTNPHAEESDIKQHDYEYRQAAVECYIPPGHHDSINRHNI